MANVIRFLIITCVSFGLSCGSDGGGGLDSGTPPDQGQNLDQFGDAGEACYPNGSCNGELVCVDNVCQVAPAPDVQSSDAGDMSSVPDAQTDVSDSGCVPFCVGKECGSDGCGGTCGECDIDFEFCNLGQCAPLCQPNCAGKECGFDGCSGTCGDCPADKPECVMGLCQEPCEPDCEGKECGSDGCGGFCGSCPNPTYMCEQGICLPPCSPDCQVSGTIYAPEGTIPISGALVYLTMNPPEPFPQNVFCNQCVDVPPTTPHAITAADGTFSFSVPTSGTWSVVIEKGGFRRVRELSVMPGPTVLPPQISKLPNKTDLALGDEIPKMAVVGQTFDEIENTLAKLGLGTVDGSGELMEGTQPFDLYGSSWNGGNDEIQLLTNWDTMSQYHVIFFPCDGSWPDSYLQNQEVLDNLKNYVIAGGRLYVTDWSYDILRQVFPEPINYMDDNGGFGDAQSGVYDCDASVEEPSMAAWLAAQGITDFELEDNWTKIDDVATYTAPDEVGVMKEFTPTVWVKGDLPSGDGWHPSTLSFQYGCGRSMFSTYHTEAWGTSGLIAQEKALLYVLLEVMVCTRSDLFD